MQNNIFNIALFGDEGGAVSSSASGANGTGDISGDAGRKDNAKDGNSADYEAVVRYGIDPDSKNVTEKEPTDDNSRQADNHSAEPTFDELINGRYKNEFTKKVNGIVQGRLRSTKAELEKSAEQNSKVETLLLNTGCGSIDELIDKLGTTNELIKSVAYENNMDPETYIKYAKSKMESDSATERLRQVEAENAKRAQIDGWIKESTEAKKTYPDFDLLSELNNPETGERFYSLISSGVIGMEDAIRIVHPEYIENALATARRKGADEAAANIQNRRNRPSENGGNSTGTIWKSDVNQLSDDDIERIIARVRRGETISFG